jgi:hypothetical protein
MTDKKITSFIEVRNSWCVAALLTRSECPLYDADNPANIYIDESGKEISIFKFADTEMTRRIVAAFDNEEAYVKQFPEDWITGLLLYKHNHNRVIDWVKQHPKRAIRHRGSKIYFIPIPINK